MRLLNKLSLQILNVNRHRGQVFIKISKKEIYFSMGAVRAFNLVRGKYIHFMEEDKIWFFFQNDDASGFTLTSKSNYGLRVSNKVLIETFIREAKIKSLPVILQLEKTAQEYGGQPIIKMNTENPKIVL